MSLSALLAAAPSPEPGSSLDEAAKQAGDAAGWVEENWSTWLNTSLRIILIAAIAIVLRTAIRRALTKLIERMNRSAQAVEGTALGGLLVNAERRRQRSEAIGSVLRSVASFLILGTAALMILGAFQINLAPLLASAGVAGVALGFGARNLVTDFLSGVFMILEDQYGVGDTIDAGVASGEVIEVGLRVTKLRGDNGEIWYVRNGEVKRIGNLSQGWSTAGVDVTVRPTENLDKVRTVITEAAAAMAKEDPWNERLWGPVEILGLDSVLLDSMTVRLSAKTMPGKALGVERELRWRIKRAFDEAGIRIVGGVPAQADEPAKADPSASVAAPSAYASTTSPQSLATAPINPPNISK
ncbi:mechanosensitive ion channel family protein [Streptomyces sp. NBC_00257]|uniref:Mechanosensitive ion channel family protein n=2 Tax=Streptomyces TaxID=1883 RepID=A0ABW2X144_9ACTN|nr:MULTISPECIES: mechanosensitive ion channel family protein [unclassified Streptomyces]WSG50833.1 mechanosensitive ion channel family protein [Streptomyces sp. NBC_01732]WSW07825.1 mechanosensitive ion channel family protein [Streptomyces sp. NBC_01005]WSX01497.1 mechanosensitive ion channel family protein [Streptomyces sp. NBC_00987]WTB54361.1 mechanosensitive ion channel family protein [Streptomyces sp. NBC_00826]WTC97335.1 mechanosensitive ion channel family protein [Streptomyces sp. NBC_0